ncbi:MAG: hypothetical protein OFPII_19460 [Osedax symbiont Rs1]|nr:MAG: hypothetical protein OFPII_19460 [Osedax symbiont Rs1]
MKNRFIWDEHSDQPYPIGDRQYKKRMKKKYLADYLRLFFVNILLFPITLLYSFFARPRAKNNTDNFFALCVNLNKGEDQVELVRELNCHNIQVRVPLSDLDQLDQYVEFVAKFKSCHVLINILQDRAHIEDKALLASSIHKIFCAFSGVASNFQIGNAINRTKWGFFSVDEYLKFYQVVQKIRDREFANYLLVGPSVIDYEYHFTIRALFNGYRLKYDKLAALLYVDRRGAPENTQTAIFDTRRKIDFLYAIAVLSRKTSSKILLTEANWPLSNTAPWAPTSATECVGEEDYANYLLRYYLLALASQKVESVYWHQLLAPGYGLVDHRDGLRKRSAFFVYKEMLMRLQGAVFERYIKEGNVHSVALSKDGKALKVVWLSAGEKQRYLTTGQVFDKLGQTVSEDVYISASPLYIVG